MQAILVVVGSALNITALVPYIVEILKGKTKPRVVSWFTWAVLAGVACAASWADGQYPSAILTGLTVIETLVIVVMGLRFGDRKFEPFDVMCQIGAIVGLALWFVFDSPAIAVLAAIAIDFVGTLPTIKHAWQKPYEETAVTFLLAGLSCLCITVAAGSWKATAIAYPLYGTLIASAIGVIVVARARSVPHGTPKKLEKLY